MPFDIPAASNTVAYPWPIGLYRVVLLAVDLEEPNPQYAKEGAPPRARFEFEVVEVIDSADRKKARQLKVDDQLLTGWANLLMSRRSVFRAWSEALLGRELADGEVIGVGDLVGKKAKATVAEYDRRDGGKGVGLRTLQPDTADDDEPSTAPAPTDEADAPFPF